MAWRTGSLIRGALYRVVAPVRRPEIVVFLPAAALAAFWGWGEGGLVVTALTVPLLHALAGLLAPGRRAAAVPAASDPITGLTMRAGVVAALERALDRAGGQGRQTGCLVLHLDGAEGFADRHGRTAAGAILRRTGERLAAALREGDCVARLDGGTFAVAVMPVRRLDLEAMLQIAARLQEAVAVPLAVDGATVHTAAAVGFCTAAQLPGGGGAALLDAAEAAAAEARRNGSGAVRAFSPDLHHAEASRHALRGEIEAALDTGAIRAFFQPQLSTDTGAISGMEALVRWLHPERGVLAPAEFLADLHAAGLSDRLGEVMLYNALSALRGWDRAGVGVPSVSVNLSPEELRNPRLADKIGWELDRFEVAPGRLTVEVLESVVAGAGDDVVLRNVNALAALGCGIDLDDFGTGHAAIGNIRRFAINRLKIDRSFVSRVDCDRDQQKVVAAILSMAERLDLQTLAEGVETLAEHAMVAQLGCGHVQGFSIARPMSFEDTLLWAERHRAKLTRTPRIGSQPG
ncbi:MAG: GGDEF domain-containing protein [Rhodobacteraceae bacterium]|nr:GGDEF domain-containing protein [Paracoccaceae bacterium]